jgi:hypothetical protein
MTQMLGARVSSSSKEAAAVGGCYGKNHPGSRISNLALELLRRCGMILRARLRTSPADERCHWLLSSRVHHSSVIWCNVLNLSRALHV